MSSTLEHLDPATLLIETNVRADLHLDAAFVASVKEHGVLVPILAVRTEQGVRVRAGQRRTAAAVDVGLSTVPVMVLDAEGTDADRIAQQLTENVHRAALTDADTVAAVEQLALLGCSAAQITKKTRIPRARVAQALLVAESDTAREAVKPDAGLDLEMAAWLAEFDDDPDRQARLRHAFERSPHLARHDVERARRERREEDAYATLLPTIEAQNPSATHFTGSVWDDKNVKYLDDLVAKPGAKAAITVEKHETCPGHAFQLLTAGPYNSNPGLVQDGIGFVLKWLCTDWKANGHHDRYAASMDSDKPEAGTDEAKQLRRMTVALNKAGDAAKAVRLEWLEQFTRNGWRDAKLMPKDWADFMLTTLEDGFLAGDDKNVGLREALRVLGLTDGETATGPKAAHLVLCARLWSHEHRASREIWRQGTLGTYIGYLHAWGYPLSPVEEAGAGHITAEQAYDLLNQEASS